ncbi:PilW family protein [Cellulomonas sp. KRMCY2]|uniref:PilW family protein n=1 Tax=Cellulomonas sp. KRMCY2 TaxID=1304865 RepID=UPI00045E8385|nr:hypothetical protein [Cellulomonas sp. KRMCY2]
MTSIREPHRRSVNGERTAPHRRDTGMSLTELVVTMMIMSFVVAGTVSLTVGFHRTTAQNMSRQEQIDTARAAVESMSRTVRAAVKPAQLIGTCPGCEDAFLEGRTTSVRFYSNVNNSGNDVGPSRVTYVLSTSGATAGQLIETIQIPESPVPDSSGYDYCDATLASADADCIGRARTRPIAFGVQADDLNPIFRYYDAAGVPLIPVSGASLTTDELARVLSIELVVTVQADNATQAAPTTYIQRIMLPNAKAVLRLSDEETP